MEGTSREIVDVSNNKEDIGASDFFIPKKNNSDIDAIYSAFIFYNPASGGNAASILDDPSLQQAVLHFKKLQIRLTLWNIFDGASGQKPGFLKLHNLLSQELNPPYDPLVRVIVAGGDGTVMWCIAELKAHLIDLDRIAIGVIPFGTGNDFARALFWDVKFSNRNPKVVLRDLAYQWIQADIVPHDIWGVDIELYESGQIRRIDPKTRKKTVIQCEKNENTTPPTFKYSYKMSNYFSMGVESRIGVGFDRYRTTNPFLNKLRYAAEGLKKSMLKHTLRVNQLVASMYSYDTVSSSNQIVFQCPKSSQRLNDNHQLTTALSLTSTGRKSTTYKHCNSASPDFRQNQLRVQNTTPTFSQSSESTCCNDTQTTDQTDKTPLNQLIKSSCSFGSLSDNELEASTQDTVYKSLSPEYAATANSSVYSMRSNSDQPPLLESAASLIAINIPSFAAGLDIWKTAHRPGIFSLNGEQISQWTGGQKLGDGKLEFLIFRSVASIGFERMAGCNGRGKKVCQGSGPFTLVFHRLHPACRVYYQVDGEFYVMSCPKQATITHAATIKVLAAPGSPYKTNYVTEPETKLDD